MDYMEGTEISLVDLMTVFKTSTLPLALPTFVVCITLVFQLISALIPSESYHYQHAYEDNVYTSAGEYVEMWWRGTLNSSTDNVHGVGP
jgi:hypothetical protein